ncbi:uncharacterized protein VTP21DRAFT_6579 [Calcarisporiella thermophila]|uniref:uncharacterized protein n=1 Tax=Calcarisporiella thermophila TaxID=911321 RepID=UPI0037434E66
MEASTNPSNAGIISRNGERVVPASRRPDGSLRKEIRIRPGYVPQEDIRRYTNERLEAARRMRLAQEAAAKEGLVAGSSGYSPALPPGYAPVSSQVELPIREKTKNQKKHERRRKKNEEKRAAEQSATKAQEERVEEEIQEKKEPEQRKAEEEPEKEDVKLMRSLQKKLQQIEVLREREAQGEKLQPEQREKVDRLPELESQLQKLQIK